MYYNLTLWWVPAIFIPHGLTEQPDNLTFEQRAFMAI